jgi:hypothetical protein
VTLNLNTLKILSFLSVLIICPVGIASPQSYSPQSDLGIIQEIIGDRVYIEGRLGNYIFEMLNTCSWCEKSLNVLVSFESFSRASIRPDPNPLNMASVQLFIIKDARDSL